MILVHVNVHSLIGQFQTSVLLNRGINIFLDTVQALNRVKAPINLILCRELFLKQGITGENIIVSIKRNRDLNLRFSQTIQKWNSGYWDINPIQDLEAAYTINGYNCSGAIQAETIELQLKNNNCILLNFIDSQFGTNLKASGVKIKNSATQNIQIDCQYSASFLLQLIRNWGIVCQEDRQFEHNPKHHINANTAFASPLNCTHQEAQLLLDSAVAVDEFTTSKLFNFDKIREQYIIFRTHVPNKYHGYHESNFNNIPGIIRTHFGY